MNCDHSLTIGRCTDIVAMVLSGKSEGSINRSRCDRLSLVAPDRVKGRMARTTKCFPSKAVYDCFHKP